MRRPRMYDPADLVGVTEVVAIIWPDGDGPKMHSKQAKVSTWARRRASTGFPAEVTKLACGPIYSRAEVANWWDGFRRSPGHLRAMRGTATRSSHLTRYCLCGASMRGRAAPDELEAALIKAWTDVHSGPGHRPTSAMKAAAARRRAERDEMRGDQDAAHRG